MVIGRDAVAGANCPRNISTAEANQMTKKKAWSGRTIQNVFWGIPEGVELPYEKNKRSPQKVVNTTQKKKGERHKIKHTHKRKRKENKQKEKGE